MIFEPLKRRINTLGSTGAPLMLWTLLEREGYFCSNGQCT